MDERPNRRLTDNLGGQQRRRHDPATDHHRRVRPRRPGKRVGGQRLSNRHLPQRLRQPRPRRFLAVELHRRVIGQTALLGNDMHHRCTRRCTVSRGALRVTAGTPQPIGAGRHRTERIGATLINGARIVLTHPARQLRDALVQRRGVIGIQRALDIGKPAAIPLRYHVQVAVTRPDLSAPQRGRIKPIHPAVDGRLGPGHRQPTPAGGLGSDRGIHPGAGLGIVDQTGARHDGAYQAIRDHTGGEHLSHPG
jgi:hypothetical protein